MSGPPSLLERDPKLEGRFLALIADGVPRAYACRACGFAYRTLYGWVRQGLTPDAPEPYASFARKLYEVEVELMRKWLTRLAMGDVETDNKALAWLLEKRFPKAFGEGASATPEPDPADDIAAELEADATESWETLRQWFHEPTEALLKLAAETGIAHKVATFLQRAGER